MKRALWIGGLLAAVGAGESAAQAVTVGVHGALGDYREVSQNLRYRGAGFGASLGLRFHKLSAEASVTRLSYDPRDKSSGLSSFTGTQFDARVGVDVASGFTAEAGVTSRTIDPKLSAQEMGAGRIGVRYSKLIGPGATVALRGSYLVGAKFTGAGSAGAAFELGLLVSAGPQNGRYRFTMDYGFQRVDRKTSSTPVPIQQSLVKLGVAVGF